MPIKSSGQLSLSEIRDYFKKTGNISLSDLYRGGPIVPDISQNNHIPKEGELSLSDFYGAYRLTGNVYSKVTKVQTMTRIIVYTGYSTHYNTRSTMKQTYTFNRPPGGDPNTSIWRVSKPGITYDWHNTRVTRGHSWRYTDRGSHRTYWTSWTPV